MPPVHEFTASLAKSVQDENALWASLVYRQVWPSLISERYVKDVDAQKSGVDRLLELEDRTQIRVEEKVRHADYGDVLLEVWSVWHEIRARRVPGWITKLDASDYLAYFILPRRECILIPSFELASAWRRHREMWRAAARARSRDGKWWEDSPNRGYVTRNLPVPRNEILLTCRGTKIVSWEDFE